MQFILFMMLVMAVIGAMILGWMIHASRHEQAALEVDPRDPDAR